jgi:Arc/MetJ family transcription regulator
MRTNVTIDGELVAEAQRLGGHRTRTATVTAALEEYIRSRQAKVLELFGTVEYDSKYDYKKQRRRS